MRAVFETLGVQDVVAKSLGSSNPYNMVRATFDALKHAGLAALGRGAPRHQGVGAAVAPPRGGDAEAASRSEAMAMAKHDRQDHHGRADRQPDPPSLRPAAPTLIGLGLNKIGRVHGRCRIRRRCAA